MNEKKFVGIVVIGGIGLTLILIVGIIFFKNVQAAAREKDIASLSAKLGDTVSKSNKFIRNRDFEQAITALQAIEPSITTVGDYTLKRDFDYAFDRAIVAERDHKEKLRNGWGVFDGKFISPDEKQRILAERKRKQEEELRRVEQERRLAEARRHKEMADRKQREEQRKAEQERGVEQERRKAEEKRKAMEPTSITWVAYMADCGVKAQEQNEARTERKFKQKYKGKRIRWRGRVVNIDTAFLSSGFTISVKMSPSDESLVSDLSLSIPRTFESLVLALNKADLIEFVGTINSQGGPLSNHSVRAERITRK